VTAGTDEMPHGSIRDEAELLHRFGVSETAAVASTWRRAASCWTPDRRSEREEHRLALALEANVEAQRSVLRAGQERLAAFRRNSREYGVGGVRLGFLGEVQSRLRLLEQGVIPRSASSPPRSGELRPISALECP